MPSRPPVSALLFDVFGTCVDWRSSLIREGEALGRKLGRTDVDWTALADAWRGQYQPQMETVRTGQRPWTTLDVLHREALDSLLPQFGLEDMEEADRAVFAYAWRRLDPWPDTTPGLTRLKARHIIAPHSNGNIALLVNMAKWAGLPWDAILGAEISHTYKPLPASYLGSVAALGLQPEQVMMVAAHNGDLLAAAACGMGTAFVPRPLEHGLGQSADLEPRAAYDVVATDFDDLADQLGA